MNNRIRLAGASIVVFGISSLWFLCFYPVREYRASKLSVSDQDGAQHEMFLVFKWPIVPLAPHLYVDFGQERWQVHSGGFGYADNAHVYVSPDSKEAVVAYQYEAGGGVFVRFDLASEKGTREGGQHPGNYAAKGWKRMTWNPVN